MKIDIPAEFGEPDPAGAAGTTEEIPMYYYCENSGLWTPTTAETLIEAKNKADDAQRMKSSDMFVGQSANGRVATVAKKLYEVGGGCWQDA